jgi:hypothetical protein
MKKKLILALVMAVLLFGSAMSASAQFRLDIDVPWWLQLRLGPALESAIRTSLGGFDIAKIEAGVPSLQAYYRFGTGALRFGIGARVYAALLMNFMNFLYPSALAELRLGRFDVNLNAGGLVGVLFGPGPTFEVETGPGVTMDLSVGYRLTD